MVHTGFTTEHFYADELAVFLHYGQVVLLIRNEMLTFPPHGHIIPLFSPWH